MNQNENRTNRAVIRKELKKSITLRNEHGEQHVLKIEDVFFQSSKTICYKAYHRGIYGILKEYYPDNTFILNRQENGQLTCQSGYTHARNLFETEQHEFIETYKLLCDIKNRPENAGMMDFIPNFEIFYGLSESGTVYVWNPNPPRVTFESFCQEIHSDPSRLPECSMVSILSAVRSLCQCVLTLHETGLIHRDIKPSNFGCRRPKTDFQWETLEFFDSDSICEVGDRRPKTGTEGFKDPRSANSFQDNLDDIYSIGATLFYALTGYLFQEQFYSELDQRIKTAKLIECSEINSSKELRECLVQILKKSLALRSMRYEDCETLLGDIEPAVHCAQVACQKSGKYKWKLTAEDEQIILDAGRKSSSLKMLAHLFSYPLITEKSAEQPLIPVLILGFGKYGQLACDLCLQMGQIPGRKLVILAVSENRDDFDSYLKERPAFLKFLNLNGETSDGYAGTLEFNVQTIRLSAGAQSSLKKLLTHPIFKGQVPYIIAALGDDAKSRRAAELMERELSRSKANGTVCWVKTDESVSERTGANGPWPIYIHGSLEKDACFLKLKQLSLNSHLVWKKKLRFQLAEINDQLSHPYYFYSSLCNSVWLQNALQIYGISLSEQPLRSCAAEVQTLLFCLPSKAIDSLAAASHRRWVIEKAAAGWKTLNDLSGLKPGVTFREDKKEHLCLRKGDEIIRLSDRSDPSVRFLWDGADDGQLTDLDEMDQMSVCIHRLSEKKAGDICRRTSLELERKRLERMVSLTKNGKLWLSNLFFILEQIWDGQTGSSEILEDCFEKLRSSAALKKEEARDQFLKNLDDLQEKTAVILQAREYRDWKANDSRIIKGIPFILGYDSAMSLIIPVRQKLEGGFQKSLGAASLLNPALIILETEGLAVSYIIQTVKQTQKMIKRHKLQTKLIVTWYGLTVPDALQEADKDGKIKAIPIFPEKETACWLTLINEYCPSSTVFITSEQKNLSKQKVYERYMDASFYIRNDGTLIDSETGMTFSGISEKVRISPDDLPGFERIVRSNIMRKETTERLWVICSNCFDQTLNLSRLLRKQEARDRLEGFDIPQDLVSEDDEIRSLFIPEPAVPLLEPLLELLENDNVVEVTDRIKWRRLYKVRSQKNVFERIKRVAWHPDCVRQVMSVEKDQSKQKICIRRRSRFCEPFQKDSLEKECGTLLDCLEENGYLYRETMKQVIRLIFLDYETRQNLQQIEQLLCRMAGILLQENPGVNEVIDRSQFTLNGKTPEFDYLAMLNNRVLLMGSTLHKARQAVLATSQFPVKAVAVLISKEKKIDSFKRFNENILTCSLEQISDAQLLNSLVEEFLDRKDRMKLQSRKKRRDH